MKKASRQQRRQRRHKRLRARIWGKKDKPRLCVFRSSKHIYAQLIDDEKGKTLASASDLELRGGKKTKVDKAREVGRLIASKALEKRIEKAVFDRAGYKYHGRIKAVAEGAREAGLKF
jgi:large subunit ribosomal protein L18